MEQNLNNEETILQYNNFKDELNDIYEEVSDEIKIRSRCNWHELGESRACQNILRKICSETQQITDLTKINTAIFGFYANLFKEKVETNSESLNNLLNNLSIPSLSQTPEAAIRGVL